MTVKWVTIENRRRARVGDEADGVGEWEAGGVGGGVEAAIPRPQAFSPLEGCGTLNALRREN